MPATYGGGVDEPTLRDLYALTITIKEAAELQSGRTDRLEGRMDGLAGRIDRLEDRMVRGFDRVEARIDALADEMRAGFAAIGQALRRRGPSRDD